MRAPCALHCMQTSEQPAGSELLLRPQLAAVYAAQAAPAGFNSTASERAVALHAACRRRHTLTTPAVVWAAACSMRTCCCCCCRGWMHACNYGEVDAAHGAGRRRRGCACVVLCATALAGGRPAWILVWRENEKPSQAASRGELGRDSVRGELSAVERTSGFGRERRDGQGGGNNTATTY